MSLTTDGTLCGVVPSRGIMSMRGRDTLVGQIHQQQMGEMRNGSPLHAWASKGNINFVAVLPLMVRIGCRHESR
ncbi:hypothetical protein H5410_014870 [Solanum commersonii]|uniref:Uncharacterized protein n=1 Tax=Solanum commersonii TaxID=4109 RepID=A0A9J5ZS54_SOLCO|nr:hypothetical protein H5410_014870 [Solanum commersonii]